MTACHILLHQFILNIIILLLTRFSLLLSKWFDEKRSTPSHLIINTFIDQLRWLSIVEFPFSISQGQDFRWSIWSRHILCRYDMKPLILLNLPPRIWCLPPRHLRRYHQETIHHFYHRCYLNHFHHRCYLNPILRLLLH